MSVFKNHQALGMPQGTLVAYLVEHINKYIYLSWLFFDQPPLDLYQLY